MLKSASLNNWLELLNLKATFEDLFVGNITTEAAESALDNAILIYPNVSGDYISVLETARGVIGDVRSIITDQGRMVDEFNDAVLQAALDGLTAAGTLRFNRVDDRLLTIDEIGQLEARQEEMAGLIEEISQGQIDESEEMEQLAEEIAELIEQQEELMAEAEALAEDAEDMMDGAEANLEDAEAELEDAASELESGDEE